MTYFLDIEQTLQNLCGTINDPKKSQKLWERRTKQGGSHYFTSNYITRPLKSKQSDTGIRTDTQINGKEQRAQK